MAVNKGKGDFVLFYFIGHLKFSPFKKKKSVVVLQGLAFKSVLNIFKDTQLGFPWSPNQNSVPPFLKGIFSTALSGYE